MARVRIYKNSFLASALSILGYVFLATGIIAAFNGEIIGGIFVVAISIAMMFGAKSISENKQFKAWKKQVEEKGYVPGIRSSVSTAIQVYNTFPCTKTLEYIRTLNPAAAENIAQQLAAKKK